MAENARDRLRAILEGRTKTPISHREFLAYLNHQTPSHRYNEHVPLVNFYDWLNTYRGYFGTLPDEERIWSPAPTSELHAAYPSKSAAVGGKVVYHPEHSLQHPYRSEVDSAVAHYMTGALFSDQAVEAVQTAAAATTHPDVFLPALEDVYRRLTPEAARFSQEVVYNINRRSRTLRVIMLLVALLLSLLMVGGFVWVGIARWYRIIALVPITCALLLLPAYFARICLIRYFLGVTERPEWDVDGLHEEGTYILIAEPRIISVQRKIAWCTAAIGLVLSVFAWFGILIIPVMP
ncbi:hypothetical protein BDF22DRAFT_174727 [Syncephalis plumigaleata]|nr:hypothetical protein BDF22DRAFT_174727 [Syncephalis plumigaleata]